MSDSAAFSIEVVPPLTAAAAARLDQALQAFAGLAPAFLSVTYGAGGATRGPTLATVGALQGAGWPVAPHLSAEGTSREEVRRLLQHYRATGIRRLVLLRGDPLSGLGDCGDFAHACDLVAFVRAESGNHFHLDVAAHPDGHPQARSADADFRHFAAKVAAGADGAITQYFYNADAYEDFVGRSRAAGLQLPIVPGIMPIRDATRLARFSAAHGIDIPRWLRRRLEDFGDDRASLRAFGLDVVTRLGERLLAAGAPGLHFFSLNDGAAVAELWRRLDLPRAVARAA